MSKVCVGVMAVVALTSVSFGAKSLTEVPVHDRPAWQVVTGSPDTPGAAVPVYSLVSDQVVGSVPVDAKFLSFGSNGEIVTFSVNGQLVYVPATAVSRLYPVPPKTISAAPPGRKSLDQLAKEYEDRVNGLAAVSLTLSDSLESKANRSAANAVVGGAGAGPVSQPNFMDPNNPMPGAALATGGIPAIGGMASQQPGYPGAGGSMDGRK